MAEIVFLGCGGGRYMTVDQRFRTGGFRIHAGAKIHVDPGPGALLLSHLHDLNPLDLDCVVVTHCHPDHYCDAEVLTEAMTKRMTQRRGVLVGSESVIRGREKWGPAVSPYHQSKVGEVVCLRPGETCEIGEVKLEGTPTKHSDPTTFGIKFHTSAGLVGYTGDTEYFEELPEYFKGSRVLIINVTRPQNRRIRWHLCSDDAIDILKRVEPELAVMIHMGMLFLRNPPDEEAARIERESGIRTVPGYPGTRLTIGKEISVARPLKQATLGDFKLNG
ncbi:MAG: MBL fold metallo-hydrolase [Hadesarchaea archaeon]|nr:MBL fold metallo-hydrolase [Hadesarchaea archaeon]